MIGFIYPCVILKTAKGFYFQNRKKVFHKQNDLVVCLAQLPFFPPFSLSDCNVTPMSRKNLIIAGLTAAEISNNLLQKR